MDGPRDGHTKLSKPDRERQIPYAVTYTWDRKYDTNELMNRLTDVENRLVVAKGEGRWGRDGFGVGMSRCELLYIGWIDSKVLL